MNLQEAAETFDGGPRSFPATKDAELAHYAYEPPNGNYMKLFWDQATVPVSQRDAPARPYSAGFLFPGESSFCKPVFIANSLLSALWLLRETLPEGTLPEDGWTRLACGAESLACGGREDPPPSAQKAVGPLSQQVSAKKRLLLSEPVPGPKRPRTENDETISISSQPSETSEPDNGSEDPPRHTAKVSNNNRRAELARSKRLALSHQRKRVELGLVVPVDGATVKEKAAYHGITKQDEPTIAWIIRQRTSDKADFYTATRSPYFTACTLLEKARVLGNLSSKRHAALFLQAWRERGSPFRSKGELASSQSRISTITKRLELPAAHDDVEKDFCFAYGLCTRCDTDMATVHIESRWAAALLGQAYARRMAQIRAEDLASSNDRTRNRYGQGKVSTQATEALMTLVGADVAEKRSFQRRLEVAKRWYTVTQDLGWGMLTLIPHEDVSNAWIERGLLQDQLVVWMELVKKERQDIYSASKALESWLGPEGVAGGPISGKERLSIEAQASAATYEIDEIRDSEDEGLEEEDTAAGAEDSDDEHVNMSPSPAPALRLRQLTLSQLFNPIG